MVKVSAALTSTAVSGGYCAPSYSNLQYLQIVSLLAEKETEVQRGEVLSPMSHRLEDGH